MVTGLLDTDLPGTRWTPWRRQRATGRKTWIFVGALVFVILELYAHIYGSISVMRELRTSVAYRIGYLAARPSQSIREEKYSIIVSTFDRYEHLLYLLDHYGNANLPNLDAIFISWGLGKVDPPKSLNLTDYRVPVYLQRAKENSLSERFRVPSKMRTEAALWTDDDLRVEASAVEFLFEAWRSYGRPHHRIVGHTARLASPDSRGQLRYLFPPSTYNMVLTNFAFMDKTMANWYWESDRQLSKARKYVSQNLNCEDILMNYVVARRTGLSPVKASVAGTFSRIGGPGGISSKPGHVHRRTMCLREFEKCFGPVLKRSRAVLRPPDETEAFGNHSVELPQQWQSSGRPWGEGKTYL